MLLYTSHLYVVCSLHGVFLTAELRREMLARGGPGDEVGLTLGAKIPQRQRMQDPMLIPNI